MTTAMSAGGAAAHVRDAARLLLGHVPALEDEVVTGLAETSVTYRTSPGVTVRHARPGDHAPDVAGLTTVDGREAWIGDLLRRPGHLLLVTGAEPGRIALVRPDGYLGLVATAGGEDRALTDHLSRALHVGGVPA
jgi:hypothetical protein